MRGCWSSLSRIGVREMLSYQSLMRVGAGTPRYEKARVVVCYGELARRILPRPTPTPAGDKPLASRSLRPRYILSCRPRPSVYNSARFAGGEPASRLIGGRIPDRSPGHAFVPMTRQGIWVSVGNDIVGDGSRWRGRTNPSAYRGTEPVAGQFKHPGSANVAMV